MGGALDNGLEFVGRDRWAVRLIKRGVCFAAAVPWFVRSLDYWPVGSGEGISGMLKSSGYGCLMAYSPGRAKQRPDSCMATRSRSNFFGDFLFCEKKVTATGVGSHPEGDQKKPQAEGS